MLQWIKYRNVQKRSLPNYVFRQKNDIFCMIQHKKTLNEIVSELQRQSMRGVFQMFNLLPIITISIITNTIIIIIIVIRGSIIIIVVVVCFSYAKYILHHRDGSMFVLHACISALSHHLLSLILGAVIQGKPPVALLEL